jgi:acetate kinase
MAAFPGALQVACFDTAFHRGHAFAHEAYALPRAYFDKGIRRYGFHGLSYEAIARALAGTALHPGRVVVAHLGNGASACGLRGGRSVASSMGFTALDGLPMGTRPGQIDPGVILYLIEQEGMDGAAISELLYRRSGLLGLSGLSSDMRVLEGSDDPRAAQAIGYFTTRVRREIAALAADLGGIEGLVFTAGIGENSARVRAEVCEGLGWLGVTLDPSANAGHAPVISAPGSRIEVRVIPTDEEGVIARAVRDLTGRALFGKGS